MKLNVKSLLSGECSSLKFDFSFPIDYKEIGYTFPEDAKVTGEVKNAGGYMPLTAKCTVRLEGQCARCLAPVSTELTTEFFRTVADHLEEEDENDEYLLVSNDEIELGEPIREELLLSLPVRFLCKEDCKGLCPKCGCDLNKQECSCDLRELDPRWAVLKKFTDNK